MSKLTCGDDDYDIDDASFEEGAGINRITKAYATVFKTIKEIAEKAEAAATAGQTKEFMNDIRIIQNKSSQLSDLQALTAPIIGANGVVYNTMGEQIDDQSKDPNDQNDQAPMEEEELLKRIEAIEKNNINISFADAQKEIENQENADNITDNGEDHGDLGEVDW